MITAQTKKPLGTARFERMRNVKYLAWEDVFEVEFDSGVTYLLSNRELRRRNRLRRAGAVEAVWVDPELRSGFFIRYDNGDTAEASWEVVKEA